jgi:polycomb group RING finger protein 4
LATTGFNYPHIVDVHWRLNFFMKSQSVDKENNPIFLLRFDTEVPGQIPLVDQPRQQSIEFSCNTWEMVDLVQKLRDAVKQFERIAGAQ